VHLQIALHLRRKILLRVSPPPQKIPEPQKPRSNLSHNRSSSIALTERQPTPEIAQETSERRNTSARHRMLRRTNLCEIRQR